MLTDEPFFLYSERIVSLGNICLLSMFDFFSPPSAKFHTTFLISCLAQTLPRTVCTVVSHAPKCDSVRLRHFLEPGRASIWLAVSTRDDASHGCSFLMIVDSILFPFYKLITTTYRSGWIKDAISDKRDTERNGLQDRSARHWSGGEHE